MYSIYNICFGYLKKNPLLILSPGQNILLWQQNIMNEISPNEESEKSFFLVAFFSFVLLWLC